MTNFGKKNFLETGWRFSGMYLPMIRDVMYDKSISFLTYLMKGKDLRIGLSLKVTTAFQVKFTFITFKYDWK